MSTFAKEVLPVNIEEEMKQSYMDYAMSVIIGRALPDVRDGLKPVHRRVLFAMSELGMEWNRPYKKSARVVGDVIGKYHPHGDTAVYDAIVRMAQPFSLRYMLVDGQGNFGSIDGDAPAAMRYTEVRMARITHELLADIDKDTVDFTPNYDETESEPAVFPARFPNLLVNGAAGIAVGLATNIPPHNLTEIINACVAMIDDPDIDVSGLMKYVPGPDFPTAAIINGSKGIREAYETGRGRVYVRARTHFEAHRSQPDRQAIIVTEIPYQVNKAALLEKIADLVREKRVEGITELRDESDKSGMRVVIELRRGEVPEVVLNNLYQHTQLQNVFGINMVALMDGQPRLLNLKDIIEAFIRHRREVVTRRTLFDLRKSRDRAHILEGLAVALANIDPIIALIKAAASPAAAKEALVRQVWLPGVVVDMLKRAGETVSRPDGLAPDLGLKDDGYHLSEVQAQAILDLRLHRLTGLEQEKITNEYKELIGKIEELLKVLSSPEMLMGVIREELLQVREQYGDQRRTEIVADLQELNPEDLITEEEVVVTFSHSGYVKTQPLTMYRAQRRGGRGKAAATVKEEDFIDRLFVASTHDTILCFSSHGKVYWLKAYDLPQGSRISRGRPILNLLPLAEGERINTILPIRDYEEGKFIFMATNQAVVKKTPLPAFSRQRSSGLIAIELQQDEYLIGVAVTDGSQDVMLFSSGGKSIRFNESEVRAMGRNARGVRGIQLTPGERVISLIICDEGNVLTATEKGFGKLTPVSEYPVQGRGGKGVISIKTSDRNGDVIGATLTTGDDEIMLITDSGTLVRTPVEGISTMGRNTQGVKLIALDEGQRLAGVEKIQSLGDAAAEEDADGETDIDEDGDS